MDFSTINFDDAAPIGSYEPLDAGWYEVLALNVEDKITKAGTGKYLKVELEVLSDNGKGRKIWMNVNYQNPNSQAQSIGKGQLTSLAISCGLDIKTVQSELEFCNKPFRARLGIKPAQGQYAAQNTIQEMAPLVDSSDEIPFR